MRTFLTGRTIPLPTQPLPQNHATIARLRWRIANASKLRDGGEMFLDLAECER